MKSGLYHQFLQNCKGKMFLIKKIILITFIPISLYSQNDFLKNFYDFDMRISRQNVISTLSKYPAIKQVVDSVKWIAFEGIEWKEFTNVRLGVEFLADTISHCWLIITDSTNALKHFEELKEFFESNLSDGYGSASKDDPEFLRLRSWRQKKFNDTNNQIQLSISKKTPHKIAIVNYNFTWLMEVESRKLH